MKQHKTMHVSVVSPEAEMFSGASTCPPEDAACSLTRIKLVPTWILHPRPKAR